MLVVGMTVHLPGDGGEHEQEKEEEEQEEER